MRKMICLIAISSLLFSCSKVPSSAPGSGSLIVRASVSEAKGLGKTDFESRINSLSCYLFLNGTLVMKGYADMDGKIEFQGLNPGCYKTVMIAGEVPEVDLGISYKTFTDGKYYLYAENNGYSSGFNMFGEKDVTVSAGQAQEVNLALGHCCAKISINSITINYYSFLSKMDVVSVDLKKIFVMDAFSTCHLDAGAVTASDWGQNGVGSFNCWNGNSMVFTSDPARYASTCFVSVGKDAYPPLYIYPTSGSDAPVSAFLVLETVATFRDGTSSTWYYRVNLSEGGRPVKANNEYSFSLLIIGPGADSPDKDAPGIIIDEGVSIGEAQSDIF